MTINQNACEIQDNAPWRIARNLEIDRLRAITILIVIYCHLMRVFFPWKINLEVQFATTLMEIFFVISGYVISATTVHYIDALKNKRSQLSAAIKNFYFRRFMRVYPAAWTVFIFAILLGLLLSQTIGPSIYNVTLYTGFYILSGTFNYYFFHLPQAVMLAPYWSLMIEEQFYLIIPLFLLITTHQKQRVILLLGMLFLLTLFIRPISIQQYGIKAIFFTQCRCDGLIYGYFLYSLSLQSFFKKIGRATYVSSFLKHFKSQSILMIIFIYYVIIKITTLNLSMSLVLPAGALLAFFLVGLAVLEMGIVSFPLFLQILLNKIGARTYSLYLIHWPCILFMRARYNLPHDKMYSIVYIGIILGIIILMGELLYQFVERPTRLHAARIAKRMTIASITING